MVIAPVSAQQVPAQGTSISQADLNTLYEKAVGGNAAAARGLGDYYASGIDPGTDWEDAISWYQLAVDASQPDVEALFTLGYLNFIGKGIPENREAARAFFTRASDADHPAASYWLADMLARGEGGEADHARAITLYGIAAKANIPNAAAAISELLSSASSIALLRQSVAVYVLLPTDAQQQLQSVNYLGELPRDDIQAVQQALLDAGHDPQGVDGYIGPNSRTALANFRASRARPAEARLTLIDLRELGLI